LPSHRETAIGWMFQSPKKPDVFRTGQNPAEMLCGSSPAHRVHSDPWQPGEANNRSDRLNDSRLLCWVFGMKYPSDPVARPKGKHMAF
jgi:hypothetical protein